MITDTTNEILFRHRFLRDHEWMTVTCATSIKHIHTGASCLVLGLSINSSFGCFGFEFAHVKTAKEFDPAIDARVFLAGLEKPDFIRTIGGGIVEAVDYDATLDKCLEGLDESEQVELRDIFEGIEDAPDVSYALHSNAEFHDLCGPDIRELFVMKLAGTARHAEGLFDRLWAHYQVELQDQAAQVEHGKPISSQNNHQPNRHCP
jgi:hypothetical protein